MKPRTAVVLAVMLLLGACDSEESADLTTAPTTAPTPTTTTTTVAPPPAESTFQLFADEGLDASIFSEGLIQSEQAIVAEMLPVAPLYEIDVSLDPGLTSLSGKQSVRFTNNEEVVLGELVFRLFPNIADGESVVTDVEVDGSPVEPALTLQDSVMTVQLPDPLAPGETTVVTMAFDVTVPVEEGGNYGVFLFDEEIAALAHFYPLLAVYDDEGWNYEIPSPSGDMVYSDAGFFVVRLESAASLEVATSGRLFARHTPASGDSDIRWFAAGPIRDFYMAASHRYDLLQAEVGETIINSFAPEEFAVESMEMLQYAKASLEMFNGLYGVYPYAELDIVSTATLASGVEYPGAIAMAMGHYDRDEDFEPSGMISTIVHEVAHQWFYGTVGNDQLDEPWLDESLAQYATWTYWGDTAGPEGAEGFGDHLDSRWARVDYADIPIGLPVASYEGAEYSAIVYGRGALFLDDLAAIMGQEAFDEFLLDYAETFAYDIASTESFQNLAEEHCGCDLSDEFEAAVYPR